MNYCVNSGAKPFQISIPQYFGIGVSAQLGEKLQSLNCKKVLIICDKGVEAAGIPAKLAVYIAAAGIEYVTYNGVQADPPDTSIGEVSDIARAEQVDGLVAIGGGSSIDTAKAVSLLSANEGPINRFFDLTMPRKPGIPLVVIPTTAGTGSEVSGGGVITETATQVKRVFITAPTMALIDPELTVGVPPKVTAACAFDVLAHCMDAIFSVQAGPLCKLIAYDGVRLFLDSVLTVYENGKDIEARSAMALASNIGGICISAGGINLCHALAHSLGARYHVAHGAACAMFTPACLEYMAEERPDEVRMLAGLFGVASSADDSIADLAHKVGAAIASLGRKVGLPSLKECAPDLEELYQIASSAMKEIASVSRSPRPVDEAACRQIIAAAYSY